MRRIVEFEADFPDDQVEVGGEIMEYGGHSAAQSLRGALIASEWFAKNIEKHSDSVWYFNMTGKFGSATIYLSDMRPKYIVTFERNALLKDLFNHSQVKFRESLFSLENAIRKIGGVNLIWSRNYDVTERPNLTIDEVMRA